MDEGQIKLGAKVDGIKQTRELLDQLESYHDLIEKARPEELGRFKNTELLVNSTDTLTKKITQLTGREAMALRINREQYTLLKMHTAETRNKLRADEDVIRQKERVIRAGFGKTPAAMDMAESEVRRVLGHERDRIANQKEEIRVLRDRMELARQSGFDEEDGGGGRGRNPVVSALMGGLGLRQLAPAYLAYRAGSSLARTPSQYLEEQSVIFHGITSGMNDISVASKDITNNLDNLASAAIMSRREVAELVSGMAQQAQWTQASSKGLQPLLKLFTATGTTQYAPQLVGMAFRQGARNEEETTSYLRGMMGLTGKGLPAAALKHIIPMALAYEQSRAMRGYRTDPFQAGLLARGIATSGQLYADGSGAGMAVQQQIQSAFQSGGARGDASRMFFMRAYGLGTGASYYEVQKRLEQGWTAQNWNDFTKQLRLEYGAGGPQMVNMAGAAALGLTVQQFEDVQTKISKEASQGSLTKEKIDKIIEEAKKTGMGREQQLDALDIKQVNDAKIWINSAQIVIGEAITKTLVGAMQSGSSLGKTIISPVQSMLEAMGMPKKSISEMSTFEKIFSIFFSGPVPAAVTSSLGKQENINKEVKHITPDAVNQEE